MAENAVPALALEDAEEPSSAFVPGEIATTRSPQELSCLCNIWPSTKRIQGLRDIHFLCVLSTCF